MFWDGVAGGKHVLSEMELAERLSEPTVVQTYYVVEFLIATAELEKAEEDIGMQSDRDVICFIYLREEE